jgi:uncharacterized protein
MPQNGFFTPGQSVLFREPWQGRTWRAFSVIVVQDNPEVTALYAPLGIHIKHHLMPDGTRVKPRQKLNLEWVLADLVTDKYTSLRLSIPGAAYSVLLFWGLDGTLRLWYINLEDPLRRTRRGFEMNDNFLDVIVEPDLSGWHWKDEDEFAEAIELGIIGREKAESIRAEGEGAANWIQSGTSPFNGWEHWRPDPSWKAPVLPEGWDKIV